MPKPKSVWQARISIVNTDIRGGNVGLAHPDGPAHLTRQKWQAGVGISTHQPVSTHPAFARQTRVKKGPADWLAQSIFF